MPRVPYIAREDLPEADRDLVARPINLLRALANHPKAMRAFNKPGPWIRSESTMDSKLRELAILQIGYLTANAYEFSHHVKISREFGVTHEDIMDVINESEGRANKLGEPEKTVLKAARDLTGDCVIANDDWKRIEEVMGRQKSMELVLIISYYNYLIRVISGLGIEVEAEYRVLLKPYQPPQGKVWR